MPVQNNIRHCRKMSGESQRDLADFLQVSQPTINSWESKRTMPSMKQIKQIARHYKIDLSDFCDLDLKKRDLELMGGDPLTVDEIQSVLKFRAIPEAAKLAIRAAINASYEEAKASTEADDG